MDPEPRKIFELPSLQRALEILEAPPFVIPFTYHANGLYVFSGEEAGE